MPYDKRSLMMSLIKRKNKAAVPPVKTSKKYLGFRKNMLPAPDRG